MVAKKQVLKELQKFNDDLNKHLPELNLDYLKNKEIFSQNEDLQGVVPLLANNLMDLKTEVALIRKNLTDSVEGMVLRVISQQEQRFAAQMDRMFTQMLVEMKGNFSSYISEVSSEMANVRKDLNVLKIENNKLISKFDVFDSRLIELQSVLADVKMFKADFPKILTHGVETQFENLKLVLEDFKSEEKKFNSELTNNFRKKFLEVSNRNIELENNLKNFAGNLNAKEVVESPLKVVESPEVVEPKLKKKTSRRFKKVNLSTSQSVEKLISIEDRIRKLDSLK